MHPYRIFEDGVIECDGQLFFDDRDFSRYCEETEYAEEYWRKEDERLKEERMQELEEIMNLEDGVRDYALFEFDNPCNEDI